MLYFVFENRHNYMNNSSLIIFINMIYCDYNGNSIPCKDGFHLCPGSLTSATLGNSAWFLHYLLNVTTLVATAQELTLEMN